MYTFGSKAYADYQPTMNLRLYWEATGDPMSDEYLPDEITASELWQMWWRRYVPDDGWVRIHWFVEGFTEDRADRVFSTVPGAPWGQQKDQTESIPEHFLAEFTWPEHVDTGMRLNFLLLPVIDKLWSPDRGDKGGFIQEHLGWKPAAFQSMMHVPTLDAVRGKP